MRTLGEALHKKWGQPVIVENRPGGNFNIGTRACAESPPDGYTICIISNEAPTYNLYMYKNLPFDLENGIVPLSNLFFLTQSLAVNTELGARSVADLVAVAKAKPKTLSYSAPAVPLILFMESLNKTYGIDLVKVPFKGGGDAINGVLTGITPITFLGIGNMIGHLRTGKMTGLLIDGDKRSPLFPDDSDHHRIRLQGAADAIVLRALCAGRHAEGAAREDRGRHPRDRQRAGFPRPQPDPARPRAGAQHARRVRRVPQEGPRDGEAHRRGRRAAGAMNACQACVRLSS